VFLRCTLEHRTRAKARAAYSYNSINGGLSNGRRRVQCWARPTVHALYKAEASCMYKLQAVEGKCSQVTLEWFLAQITYSMTRFVALGPRKLRVKDVHVWKSIATEIPDLKGRAESRLVVIWFTVCSMLKWPNSKISELEKQVQLLATVVNTRGQSTIGSFSASSEPQISGNSIETSSHPAISSWQRSQDSQVEGCHSLATVPAALSSTSARTAAITSPEHALVRPLAIIPRQIETLQLKPDEINHLFEM
jgi:hypothetical protein